MHAGADSLSDLDRIRWQCRRGMLELDLVLNRFVEQDLSKLTPAELQVFGQLLDEPDTRLLAWVMGQVEPPAQYETLIECMRKA